MVRRMIGTALLTMTALLLTVSVAGAQTSRPFSGAGRPGIALDLATCSTSECRQASIFSVNSMKNQSFPGVSILDASSLIVFA